MKAVPPYQQVRREFLRGRISPSTSIAQQALLLPGADMNIQAMAVIPEKGFEVEHLKHELLKGRPTSGYSPAVTAGDFIFVPGITSLAVGDEPQRNGVAAAALMAEGAQWGGQPIKLETEFIITKRMAASLALAGARLDERRARAGLSHRPRRLFGLQRGVDAAFRRGRPDRVDHSVHRAWTRALRRQDRDQRDRGETRQRGRQAPCRRRRRDCIPSPAAGREGGRSSCSSRR